MTDSVFAANAVSRRQPSRAGIGTFFMDELSQQFRSKGLWVCFFIMALMFYRYVSESYWDELVGSGRVPVNAPIVIYYIFAFSTYWAAIFATSFLTSPVLRDLRYSVAPIVYAMPFRDRDYLIGRYLAGQVALLFVMSGVLLGFVLLSWLKPSLGSESLHTYMEMPWGQALHSFALFLVPACFFFGSVHFALATLTGRMTPSYAFAVIVTLVFLSFELSFQGDTFAKRWPEILDPVGYITLQGQVFYWTAEQRMSQYIALNETMLLNRGLYLGLGVCALLVLWRRANLRSLFEKARARRRSAPPDEAAPQPAALHTAARNPLVGRNRGAAWPAGLMLRVGWNQFVHCSREKWFIVAAAAGFVMAFCLSLRVGALYRLPEGNLLPTALDVLDQPVEMYVIVGIIVVAFAVGEILSRERIARVREIVDSSPASTGFLAGSKVFACFLAVLVFTMVPAAAVLSVQLIKGYGDIEWRLYVYTFGYGVLPSLATYAAISAVIHIVVNQRAAGHALATITCFSVFMMEEIEVLEHPLALIGFPVLVPLTAFDALGQFHAKLLHLNAYYLAIAGGLLVAASWLWPRGIETGLLRRLSRLPGNVRRGSAAAFAGFMVVAAVAGSAAHNILSAEDDYKNIEQEKAHDALYERRFRALADVPQPKVVSAAMEVDLWPRERRMRYAAGLTLENRTGEPITRLELEADDFTRIVCITETSRCAEPPLVDEKFRRYRYVLATPLQPSERRVVRIEAVGAYDGYGHNEARGPLAREGSFVTDSAWPMLGYDRDRELTLAGDRRFHGLPLRRALPTADEAAHVRDFAISSQGDRLDYELTVTTDAGQVAIAPGELIATEQAGDRATFRYRDRDALWSFVVASADYATRTGHWNGDADAAIEIAVHHLPRHSHNVARILDAARASLDFLVPAFGPPPHARIRIVESPELLAEKPQTAGNMITLPEKDGWLHDYRREPGRDWILYTLARETSRMWWGQRVTPGDMQGSVLLAESIPEYLALRVVEKVNGADDALDLLAMKRDVYLRRRVKEDQIERPPMHADGEEFAAEKGLLALFAARSILGADRLDAALAAYAERAGSRSRPPHANVVGLYEHLVSFAETPVAKRDLVAAFTRTSLYDFRVRSARLSTGPLPANLQLEIEASRFDVTQDSNHAAVPFSRNVPVAFLDSGMSIDTAHFVTLPITEGLNVTALELPFQPASVVIDPYARFVDLNIRDNSRQIQP